MDDKFEEMVSKADEAFKIKQLAEDPKNVEYWESKKETMEKFLKGLENQTAEAKFLIECYEKKIASFDS